MRLLAYVELTKMGVGDMAPRTHLIMSYALCGFANLGSLAIMIAGLTTILGVTFATLSTAAMVGIDY
jgi:nucleoside permease NupC